MDRVERSAQSASLQERVAARKAEFKAHMREREREALAQGKVWFRGSWCDGPVLLDGHRLYLRRWTSPDGEDCESVAVASLNGQRHLALWISHGALLVGYVLRGSRKMLQFPGASLEELLAEAAVVHG